MICKFDLTESVFEVLTPSLNDTRRTIAKIVMLMKTGLAETKHCRNE